MVILMQVFCIPSDGSLFNKKEYFIAFFYLKVLSLLCVSRCGMLETELFALVSGLDWPTLAGEIN